MVWTSLLLSLALAQGEVPQIRRELPNGIVVWAERVPYAKEVSVQLWASSAGVEESPTTNGYRHLVEHLAANGADGGMDTVLESSGAYLRARTYRDATQFEINVAPKDLDLGLAAIKSILTPVPYEAEEVAKEASVIEKEALLQEDVQKLTAAAWKVAYGEQGLDPLGDLELLKSASADDIRLTRSKMLRPGQLAVVLTGPLSPDLMIRKAFPVLSVIKAVPGSKTRPRGQGKGGHVEIDALGEARAVPVGRFDAMESVATLMAALAMAANVDSSNVIYTPTIQNGLVILARTDSVGGIEKLLKSSTAGDRAAWFDAAKSMTRNWVKSQIFGSAIAIGGVRGNLLCQSSIAKPESMLDAIEQVTWKDFVAAIGRFESDRAVVVVGR